MIITFISDTHSKHKQVTQDLIGGDLLIHTGDLSSVGKEHEIRNFLKWFNMLNNYTYKVFIPGNHDRYFELFPDTALKLVAQYPNVIMLKDTEVIIDGVKIYGSPWQPEFCDWSFNLPRNGKELANAWSFIPEDTDILLTHGPVYGTLDRVIGEYTNLGCEKLKERMEVVQPKIHSCGHIHSARGYMPRGYASEHCTHHFNGCILNDEYVYTYKPMTIDWDRETNDVIFI